MDKTILFKQTPEGLVMVGEFEWQLPMDASHERNHQQIATGLALAFCLPLFRFDHLHLCHVDSCTKRRDYTDVFQEAS